MTGSSDNHEKLKNSNTIELTYLKILKTKSSKTTLKQQSKTKWLQQLNKPEKKLCSIMLKKIS